MKLQVKEEMAVVMKDQETRKGQWTEQEDLQLVCFVSVFGERRWDFIAKVSGLNRAGKSCRLRWVNYLHPGLKRGHMTSQEERLVLELHSKWGNRWSRIARRLPGRTDNEIKNYWRTHMRQMAQKQKRNSTSSPSSTSVGKEKLKNDNNIAEGNSTEIGVKAYPMDQIWNEIDTSEWTSCPSMASPMWEYCSVLPWKIDDHEEKDFSSIG